MRTGKRYVLSLLGCVVGAVVFVLFLYAIISPIIHKYKSKIIGQEIIANGNRCYVLATEVRAGLQKELRRLNQITITTKKMLEWQEEYIQILEKRSEFNALTVGEREKRLEGILREKMKSMELRGKFNQTNKEIERITAILRKLKLPDEYLARILAAKNSINQSEYVHWARELKTDRRELGKIWVEEIAPVIKKEKRILI